MNLVAHPKGEKEVLLHEQDQQPLRFQILDDAAHRIKYFEKTYAYLKKQKHVLFWTGEEILEWYRAVRKAEG